MKGIKDIASLERRLQALEQSNRQSSTSEERRREQVRKCNKRRHQKGEALARAVFVLSRGKTESFKRCCAEFGLDVDTTSDAAENYVQNMNEQAAENEYQRLRITMSPFPVAVRKYVLENSLVTWVDDSNEKVGFAPTYGGVLSGRTELQEKLVGCVTADFASAKAGSQWTRRFVQRHKLTWGRIERHVHETRAQLLSQVFSG